MATRIRNGYEISYDCPRPTPMLLMLSLHPSREPDLLTPHAIMIDPPVPTHAYHDGFGNTCTRIVAPEGRITLRSDFIVADSGEPDPVVPSAAQQPVEDLPDDVLVYLLSSRYCEVDRLSDTAWSLFGASPPGWARVQAICDYVHGHISFGYEHAHPSKTAWDVYMSGQGVCRDFAHLAVTFARCMNIPARYCTGFLGDIGLPPPYPPGDFCAWFEAWLDGTWYTFDARYNTPRIGRVLMTRGRDAADVAITTTFGTSTLAGFMVFSDELTEPA